MPPAFTRNGLAGQTIDRRAITVRYDRMDMQQQLIKQPFCRLCRYNLYRAWLLTKTGILKRSAPPRSAVCAPLLGSIAKKEEELKIRNLLLTQAKDEVISRLIAGERVFTEGKRSRIPVTPRMDQRSRPTSSPAS